MLLICPLSYFHWLCPDFFWAQGSCEKVCPKPDLAGSLVPCWRKFLRLGSWKRWRPGPLPNPSSRCLGRHPSLLETCKAEAEECLFSPRASSSGLATPFMVHSGRAADLANCVHRTLLPEGPRASRVTAIDLQTHRLMTDLTLWTGTSL